MKACLISTNPFNQMIGMRFFRTLLVRAAGELDLLTSHTNGLQHHASCKAQLL